MKLKTFPNSKKIYVISDLHGGLEGLKYLISNMVPESYLLILGDMFEKGKDSLATLEYVMELSKQPWVFVIMGNNDVALVRSFEDENDSRLRRRLQNPRSIVYQMINQLGLSTTDVDLREILAEHFKDHLNFIASLDTVIELEHFVFVHAGVDHESIEQATFLSKVGMDNFYQKGHCLDKIVVCGHYPVAMYYLDRYDNSVLFDFNKRIISIDGGYGATNLGQLNMLEISQTDKAYRYQVYTWNPFKKVRVTKDQAGLRENRGLCWPNYDVEVLEKGPYFSMVRSLYNGDVVRAKNELLNFDGDVVRALDDIPHNFLDVKANDEVAVIFEQFEGYILALKDGECGWIDKDKVAEINEVKV